MIYFFQLIEWILNLFLSKKANEVKKQAFLERQTDILKYAEAKATFDRKQAKYNGKIKLSPRL